MTRTPAERRTAPTMIPRVCRQPPVGARRVLWALAWRFVALAVVAAVGAGCAQRDRGSGGLTADGTIELIYWRHHHASEKRAMDRLIAEFERDHPGIRVRLQLFPYDVYRTKVVATLTTGEGPHIINIHDSWSYGYIQSALILPLPPRLFPVDRLDRELFPLARGFARHGAYYALPIGAGNLALYYNRELFRRAGLDPDSPPRSWSELVRIGKKLARRDTHGRLVRAGASIGTAHGQGWNYFVDGVLRQAGVRLLADDERAVRWDSPKGAAALRWYTGLVTRHGINSYLLPEPEDAFRLGLSAMFIEGPWEIGRLRSIAPELDYGVAPVPAHDSGRRSTYGSVWGNAVTRRATGRVREAAWKFLRFLSSYPSMKRWCLETGEVPMRRRVLEDRSFVARVGRLQPFLTQMPYAHASLRKSETVYRRAITDAIDEVLLEHTPPRAALTHAARRVDEMLARE